MSIEQTDREQAAVERRFEDLIGVVSGYLAADELQMMRRAFHYASAHHAGQRRKSGEPFVAHPVEVACILAELRMDAATLCAALLHDTIEDTDATYEDVAQEFGGEVADLVQGVTKITRIAVESLTDEQAATLRKMLVAMSKDIRIIVIKLADRLHNMRTLTSLREDRRIFKARETLEIYAPIAHRLGISSIKWELEDLAFYYLEPSRYRQISRMISETRAERERYLDQVIATLRAELDKAGIEAQIMGRPKHLYSIYLKMRNKDKDFSDIFDLSAVRIVVQTLKDCYSALGAVHTLWHPMPGRFKDYIAMPKFNMYQSLHTTVLGPEARPLEVQIRTEEMNRTSEYGVAAHWLYKEQGGRPAKEASFDQQLAWLRQMIEWGDESSDSREFLKNVKVDLDSAEVFVFTPKGEVKSLRQGSTPIDFAYAIHTEVGNRCVGAKVNGLIVPLSYQLKMGDRVQILTQKSATPSRGWLDMVRTPSARSKIRAYFSRATRSDDIAEGHDRLAQEMRKHGLGISNATAQRALKAVAKQMGYKDVEDMLVAIGTSKESAFGAGNRLLREMKGEPEQKPSAVAASLTTGKMPPMLTNVKQPARKPEHASNGVVVKGAGGMLVRLSKCCTPVPGDQIIGFITRGRGVSVHRADCPNATDLKTQPERIIEVEWEKSPTAATTYKVDVLIEAIDRMNLLRDVVVVLSEEGADVLGSSSATQRDGVAQLRFKFQVSDVGHVDDVLIRLLDVEGVFEARRMQPGEAVGVGKRGRH
ncbi:bifunctional (p)ppGpp synthetase/guanosine-3',5'-bis(diphosphate) 3'-pyrophosphohydrolase [Berryella wangjianweii]|uniref:Bifunctional (P)ppGpp synthetase/guanosine-3',5'-bis(Diphosphate) 3'-pyrophosphohydrolase n=1 Tax=Berryella wangjianweii TaxID=2734634 RepID=A0A6M8J5V9_9ACTN|nr:bifunctional (p)ppGpp synthetase/guanosine-3',5'-bis(diphosphate) 3'-pyrophosphohydrolase [Berryella wangjianweii]NPD32098.1 bifunctional (p)ppGpp synthetase/guanosine-3',5'-bis(diphosphate) 3'-pyrophosphohydrolase [Eggerthellaceae bacterium zg-997]QKF07326.1 bifunctional (p)ppGpp synthetase/guanosine-3',5'-bis(diphosphate) 3'-pyrophosphohydrolase [Berryella wangjianweii]